ncbi:hypothetical protein CsatA_003531 [Cannabis sativa]
MMEFWWSSILCLILTWAILSLMRSKPSSGNLPPGPKPLPVIGNLHQLGDKPHKSLTELAKLHGPLMSLKLGQVTTIVVSSSAVAKEVLQTHDQYFSNRTIPDALYVHGHESSGLPWIPVSNLLSKVKELVEKVEQSSLSGAAVDIGSAAFTTTLNLLSNTIFSFDLADSESELARDFKDITWNLMKEAGTPNLSDYFPLLKKIDPFGIRRRIKIHFSRILQLVEGIINERECSDFVKNDDVLDTLLNIMKGNDNEINRHQIVLFVAGTDTTAATFQWAMAELLRNPETMSKARAELDQIIGKGKPVKESDVSKLPYLQAVLKETFRLHPAVPLLLPRKAERDVEINGFTVPKGKFFVGK